MAAGKVTGTNREVDAVVAASFAARTDLSAMAKDLFGVVLSGAVKIEIKQTYQLKDAAQAHRDLESRKTVGSTVLTV